MVKMSGRGAFGEDNEIRYERCKTKRKTTDETDGQCEDRESY